MLTFLKQGDLARGEGWWAEGAAGGPIPGPRGPGPQAAGPGAPQRASVGGQQPRSKQPWRWSLQRAVVRARLCERLSGETCTPASGAGLPVNPKSRQAGPWRGRPCRVPKSRPRRRAEALQWQRLGVAAPPSPAARRRPFSETPLSRDPPALPARTPLQSRPAPRVPFGTPLGPVASPAAPPSP